MSEETIFQIRQLVLRQVEVLQCVGMVEEIVDEVRLCHARERQLFQRTKPAKHLRLKNHVLIAADIQACQNGGNWIKDVHIQNCQIHVRNFQSAYLGSLKNSDLQEIPANIAQIETLQLGTRKRVRRYYLNVVIAR